MTRNKKTPDYLNLPFEVNYSQMWVYGYELFHAIGKKPKKPQDYIGVIYKNSKARGATFRSENAGNGSLIYVLGGQLDEFVPDWLEFIEEEDLDVKAEEKNQFEIIKGEFVRGDDIDEEDLEEFDYGDSWEFYSCEDVTPAYLVLDADGTRVVVDSEGYCLAEDDTRIGDKPLVTFTAEEVECVNLFNKDYQDVRVELANYFKN